MILNERVVQYFLDGGSFCRIQFQDLSDQLLPQVVEVVAELDGLLDDVFVDAEDGVADKR